LEKFHLGRREHGFYSNIEPCMLKILNTVKNNYNRWKTTASNEFFSVSLNKKLKNWNSVLTLESIPCKFQRNSSKEVAAA
jgi:hypothetical protein